MMVTAQEIVDAIHGLSGPQREQLAADLAHFFWAQQRSRAVSDMTPRAAPRVLSNGNEVNTLSSGEAVGFTNSGQSRFPVLNFQGGSAHINSTTNGVQVDINVGGGADCMFDVLVSSCFASLAGFTEGQSFTSLSGCTFYGYSTVQGGMTKAAALNPSRPVVVAICSGTYTENVALSPATYATPHAILVIAAQASASWLDPASPVGWPVTVNGGSSYAFDVTRTAAGQSGWNASSAFYFKGIKFTCDGTTAAYRTGDTTAQAGATSPPPIAMEDCQVRGLEFARVMTLVTWTRTNLVNADMTTTGTLAKGNYARLYFRGCDFGNRSVTLARPSNSVATDNPTLEITDCTSLASVSWSTSVSGTNVSDRFVLHNVDMGTQDATKAYFINYTQAEGGGASGGGAASIIDIEDVRFNRNSGNAGHFDYVNLNSSQTSPDTAYILAKVRHCHFPAPTTGSTNHYVSVSNTGTGTTTWQNPIFSDNEFEPGASLTAAVVTETATLVSPVITDNAPPDSIISVTTSGASVVGSASGNSAFVTIGNDATLSAERALTAGNGVGFTDGGANSTVTLNLKDLTGNWTQAGVFDISTAGNLTVLKHAALGASSAISNSVVLNLSETMDIVALGAATGLNATPTVTLTADTANAFTGMLFGGTISGAHAMTATPGAVGVDTNFLVSGATVTDIRNYQARLSNITLTGTVTNRYGFYAANALGTNLTLTNQYGLYIENMTKGGTLNRAIYSAGGTSVHLGPMSIGQTAAPSASAVLDLTNATNLGLLLPVIANASQPTGAAGLAYYDSTKKAIYAYEDDQSGSNNVYQALHGIEDKNFFISGGGSVIAVNSAIDIIISFACTIIAWSVVVVDNVADSATIDLLTASNASSAGAYTYTSTVGAGTKPNVSSAVGSGQTTPSSWTSTAIAANTIVQAKVTSAPTNAKGLLLNLKLRKT